MKEQGIKKLALQNKSIASAVRKQRDNPSYLLAIMSTASSGPFGSITEMRLLIFLTLTLSVK